LFLTDGAAEFRSVDSGCPHVIPTTLSSTARAITPVEGAGRTVRRLAMCKSEEPTPSLLRVPLASRRHPETWSSWISRLAASPVRTNAR
jgi:hypothetical protein